MFDAAALGGKILHPESIEPSKPEVHARHPFRNEDNHAKLLHYVRSRLVFGKQARDNKIPRYVEIDKAVSGWMRLSPEDRKRRLQKEETGDAQLTNLNLPLSFVHLDDMMTYFAQTFSPNRGMFYHTGKPGETDEATQIVTLMNNHAIYAGYYRETLLTIFSLLKYNLGGFHCYWSRDEGPKLVAEADQLRVETETKWQGNRLESLDMYNTMWDPSVHPTKLHQDGEWCARARMVSHYWLRNKCNRGIYFNADEELKDDRGITECVYYRSPPKEAQMDSDESKTDTNYSEWFSEAPEYATNSGFELVEVYIRLNPVMFGLLDGGPARSTGRNRYEIWRITILNDKKIIEASYQNNIHGFLPMFLGLVNDDLMSLAQKSVGEILLPLQDFASFLVNTHAKATRKNIFGTTFYDPTIIDMDSIPAGEVNARVKIKPAGYGKDIRMAVYKDAGQLDTKQTLGDLEAVMGLINQFFPTQALPSQIASIDRAVDSQVAAVQQGANRRMQKTARLLDDSLFRWVRFCCYYNIIQYQADGAQVTDFQGKQIKIDLQKLRATDLPFIIGQGLKAIDRQMAAGMLQTIIFAIMQNQFAAQEIDILALIDYWTSMIDIDVDMKQFRRTQTGQMVPQQAQAPTDTGVAPVVAAPGAGAPV